MILIIAAVVGAGCAGTNAPAAKPSPGAGPGLSTATSAPANLVRWKGPVEHLFFHTLVVHPGQAFTADRRGQGFRDYFVTESEFRAILDQLDANGWTLVDLHRVIADDVEVPAGRRPFVLSEDDVNYYGSSRDRGLGWRLVLDQAGDVKVEVGDGQGVSVTDDDLVPIVDRFVVTHPLFSAQGAKGVLALTAYEGLLGERLNGPDAAASTGRAVAVAARLRATGWTFASHSYGHIDLTKVSAAQARTDTERWLALATPVIGPTDVYIYPYGSRPPSASPTAQMLRELGFPIQCDIDAVPRLVRADGIVVMSRRHVDGIAFAQQKARLAPLFDVAAVADAAGRAT